MYKIFALICGLSLGSNSFASVEYYVCGKVNGVSEWVIEIDLRTRQAGFFDNDSWSILPLAKEYMLEIIPPQKIYLFEGPDMNGSDNDLLSIRFNKSHLKASVTAGDRTWIAMAGCREVPYPETPIGTLNN